MKFPVSVLDEIRQRLPVSDVVGQHVKLQRRGREFVGLSPFNAEKTPSFTVNDEKGFYYCFSSGKHGDIFRFLMDLKNLTFPEAVQQLGSLAGVQLPTRGQWDPEKEMIRRRQLELLKRAKGWFRANWHVRDASVEAANFMIDRGVSPDLAKRFGIGYAPRDRQAMQTAFCEHGWSVKELCDVGLVVDGDDIAKPYDRYSNRITLPICDLKGDIVGFGGRALDGNARAKYINSPETALFKKGLLLYNYHLAKPVARQTGRLLVVEGYMDVVTLAGAGCDNAVAPLGTALTHKQLMLLWNATSEPVFCFDGDRGGRAATSRAADLALEHLTPGKSIWIASLPDDADPDDFVRAHGNDAFVDLIQKAIPLARYIWNREKGNADLTTPERRAMFEARLRDLTATIRDEMVRGHYQRFYQEQFARLMSAGTPAGPGAFA